MAPGWASRKDLREDPVFRSLEVNEGGLPSANSPTPRRPQEAWKVQKQGTREVPLVTLREVGRHCGTFNDD